MIVGGDPVVITMAVRQGSCTTATFPTGTALLEFSLTFLVGALSFAALALAFTAAIPNADAAPAHRERVDPALLFLSGIFIPIGDESPAWIRFIGAVFPVKHFADAMRAAYLSTVRCHAGRAGACVRVRVERSSGRRDLGRGRIGAGVAVLQLGTAEIGRCARLRARAWTSAAHHLCR